MRQNEYTAIQQTHISLFRMDFAAKIRDNDGTKHLVLKEPVVYVCRRYLDYDDQVIEQKDSFIESLTHDSIIVQIPYLQGYTCNHHDTDIMQ